ncbi:MAG: hypothetical protein LBK60_06275 [Verrucomicrobiales bacterium]|jgi:hypothetical protein|nr:hypothetical protein [Verrucomicrobiales bacterium]
MDSDQVQNFIRQTDDIPPPDGQGDPPLIPFPTSYRLTGEQERELVDYAVRRLDELETELGRKEVLQDDWFVGNSTEDKERPFMAKRQLYTMLHRNDVSWRPGLLGGVFQDSNLTVPLARRIARQMVARANNYFFGTEPWFAVYPVGVADRELARDIERYMIFKFDENNQKHVLETAVEAGFVRGEGVVKTTYETREQIYQQQASVLVDGQGRDLLGADGDYILDSDLWVAETESEVDPATGQPGAPVPTGRLVLKRDGVTPQPPAPRFASKLVTRKITQFKGAESALVYYKDFLCPLAAESVQQADCVAHLYDLPVMHLADLYRRKDLLNTSTEESRRATARAIELIRNMAGENGEPKAAANRQRSETGDGDPVTVETNNEPVAEIAELHLRYDANGDGIMEDIMLVLDRRNQLPIFYDYEANVTPDGLRPFDVVTPNKVEGRWYGMGAYEMFESAQEIVDLLVNRWNFSQSRAGRIDLWRPYNTLEGEANRSLKLNWGETYTPKPGMKKEDIIESVYLNDTKFEQLHQMFQFFLQMATNESGVANANDARAAGLDTGKLATGVRNIEKSGQEMFALYLSTLEPGLQEVVKRATYLTFANLDADEVFTFFEGDQETLGMLRAQDVRDLRVNVAMLLTRYRGEQLLQSSLQAKDLVAEFYGYPVELQPLVAPFFVDMLKSLQINFANEIIVPGKYSTAQPAAPANPQTGLAALGAKPPATAEANL